MIKRNHSIFFALVVMATLVLSSCKTPQVAYFADITHGQTDTVLYKLDIRLRPEDKLSIIVKSMDPQLSELFNLPIVTHRMGSETSTSHTSTSFYTVDSNGEIDFPVLGKLKVSGMGREEVSRMIKNMLISQNLVKDPIVTVEYANLAFDVLGEVNKPGRYHFTRDHLTLLDALSMAGDLTIQGCRETVMVIRETDNGRITYMVNLKSGKELVSSPVYYLQQNDVVYVEPNDYRSRQTTVNGNRLRSSSFWISLASLAISVILLVKKL